MKLFEMEKIVAAIGVILVMASTTFMFWQATPKAAESNNGNGNIIIGQDGTFTTEIVIDPIDSPNDD